MCGIAFGFIIPDTIAPAMNARINVNSKPNNFASPPANAKPDLVYVPVKADTPCLTEPFSVNKPLKHNPLIYPEFKDNNNPSPNTKYASVNDVTPMFFNDDDVVVGLDWNIDARRVAKFAVDARGRSECHDSVSVMIVFLFFVIAIPSIVLLPMAAIVHVLHN